MIEHITVHLKINKSVNDNIGITMSEAFRDLMVQLLRESKYTKILSVTKIKPTEIIEDDNIHEYWELEVC